MGENFSQQPHPHSFLNFSARAQLASQIENAFFAILWEILYFENFFH